MKDIKLKSNYKPLALILQIEPSNGEFVEGSLICQVNIEGHQFRHDLWWDNISPKDRDVIQKLIVEAIDSLMTEEAIHTSKLQEMPNR